MNALTPVIPAGQTGVDLYRLSTNAADICKEIVLATAKKIGDRQYVGVEGWEAIALAHGCVCSSGKVEEIESGVRAVGYVRRMSDGQVIAEAEGFVGRDETTWYGGKCRKWRWGEERGQKIWYDGEDPKRHDYAIRAMAQTRAISRAARSAFAHVVVMMNAGLSTTPAEEVPAEGFQDDVGQPQQAAQAKPQGQGQQKPQQQAQGGAQAKQQTQAKAVDWRVLDDEMDACKTAAELAAWNQRRSVEIGKLPKQKYELLADKYLTLEARLQAEEADARAGAQTNHDTPFN